MMKPLEFLSSGYITVQIMFGFLTKNNSKQAFGNDFEMLKTGPMIIIKTKYFDFTA